MSWMLLTVLPYPTLVAEEQLLYDADCIVRVLNSVSNGTWISKDLVVISTLSACES